MCGQGETEGAQDAHHGAKFGIATLAEGLVQTLSIEIGRLGDLGHAARARHYAQRITHEGRIAGFKRRRDIGSLPFRRVEIFGSIEPRRSKHHRLFASSRAIACARLMSRCCVRLSPPHSRMTTSAPRWT